MPKEVGIVELAPGKSHVDEGVAPMKYQRVLRALWSASSVQTHRDFYNWLQKDIGALLPHSTLVVAWGDFGGGDISYDVASSRPGVNTQAMAGAGLESAMRLLFEGVSRSSSGWLVLKGIQAVAAQYGLGAEHSLLGDLQSGADALLIHAMHDERDSHDCLFIFSLDKEGACFDTVVLDLIIPHLDSALRRVKCLNSVQPGMPLTSDPCLDLLSGREQEVLHWVSEGKSNEEIGTILGISHNTVKNHLKRIFNKMGVTARSQAVRVYMQGATHAL